MAWGGPLFARRGCTTALPGQNSTMARTGRELEQARGIDRDVFCAQCAYNLRTRPSVGRCPDCGGEYDCRPMRFKGILMPADLKFPFGNFFWAGISGVLGLFLLMAAVNEGAYLGILAGPAHCLLCAVLCRLWGAWGVAVFSLPSPDARGGSRQFRAR
jgi:hypothetical protein